MCVCVCGGGLAQMVERSLSMREVPGSIPGSSNVIIFFLQIIIPLHQYIVPHYTSIFERAPVLNSRGDTR